MTAGSAEDTGRWAVYYAPPRDTPHWRLGTAWLGRDPETGETPPRPDTGISAADLARLTATAAGYGFHATLKPPFALAAGRTEAELRAAVAELAAGLAPFDAPPLRPARLGDFRALVPAADCLDLDRLAAACVRGLDGFRAPPTPAELARRLAAGLTPGQQAMLDRWGYPYVLGEFRFHMTLTDPVPPDATAAVDAALEAVFAPLRRLPLPVRELALFRQTRRGEPFRLVERFPLAAGPAAR
ncbi:DUF1045 domain-containing protein [Rhodocista pekingensis]|uniref:DUF1045 domain-containing protein n=1 Tax=Rhodocista pekingensis TaxID=201185 RepID=A0ABW2KY58_9PROT